MSRLLVTVTWMDAQQESYRVESYLVSDGLLVLTEDTGYGRRDDRRVIPLVNVRVWKVERL